MCAVCALSCCVLFGCKNESPVSTPAINMERYFSGVVESSPLGSGTVNYNLSQFLGDTVDQSTVAKHKTIKFSRNGTWLTGMFIERVYFYVYCDKEMTDGQLEFLITGLDGGTYDPTLPEGTYKVEKNIGVATSAGGSYLVGVDVNHRVLQDGFSLVLNFTDDLDFGTFNWSIYKLTVYGEIRLS